MDSRSGWLAQREGAQVPWGRWPRSGVRKVSQDTGHVGHTHFQYAGYGSPISGGEGRYGQRAPQRNTTRQSAHHLECRNRRLWSGALHMVESLGKELSLHLTQAPPSNWAA